MRYPLLKKKSDVDAVEHFTYIWDHEPYVGDHVRLHFKANDPWIKNYQANQIVDGDTGTIGRGLGPPERLMFLVHLDKPKTRISGLAFYLHDLEPLE